MMQSFNLLVDGEWIGANQRDTAPVINPANQDVIGALPMVRPEDLDRALETAARAFATWRQSTPDTRSKVLRGAATLLRERIEEIAKITTIEQGKPLAEARTEILAAAALFDFYAEECRRTYGRVLVRPTGTRSMVLKEPIGPVAAFAPWNFPIHNPARKLGAPIAAGCSVIMKPPEESPGAALAVARALLDAGLPPGVMQIVFGEPDMVSRRLLGAGVIRHLSFTGSTTVGKHLMGLAAQNAVRSTMELGGHAPVLVFDDADLDRAVTTLVAAKYRNAGQVCVSPTRFYVQHGIYERFVKAFEKRTSEIVTGNGLLEGVNMGPLANKRRPAAVQALISDALDRGASLRAGGERSQGPGFFFKPTILTEVPPSARIMSEEPFGPVAMISPFHTLDDAIKKANSLPYGLASFVFTESAKTAMLASDALESGMVGINGTTMAAADSPFGGIKHSGHGSEDGPEGLSECMVTKAVHHF